MAGLDDFILTLESDAEDDANNEANKTLSKRGKRNKTTLTVDDEVGVLDPEFSFDLADGLDNTWGLGHDTDMVTTGSKPRPINVDDIIARRKARTEVVTKKRKRDEIQEEEEEEEGSSLSGSGDEDGESAISSEAESGSEEGFGMAVDEDEINNDSDDPLASSESGEEAAKSVSDESEDGSEDSSEADSEEETQAQKDRKAAFFAPAPSDAQPTESFTTLNLSRPILRAVSQMNFQIPTPIQASTIPVALAGHDVLGSAVTGSGKTAAFMIPCLERLIFRDKSGSGEIRVLILVPTRELAVQCADVGKSLARFMDISFGVVVGGLSVKAQEATLRSRPDILIATPGRLIDHLQNTPSFSLSALDILILDEADRMLSDGFADELGEIISACPRSRQTMLFSATMTDDVDSLVRLSLNRPVRLFVDPKKSLARGLDQEFVRVRKEDERQAFLCVLCKRTARSGTIVFFRSKKLCHQMRIVFGLLGLRAGELHGDLTQEQRLTSLRQFRDREVDYLLATDLASRGLDIKGIETVINYDLPGQIELYLHRVGRTARAGEKGRSISLVGESDRKMLKAVIKRSEGDRVRHRVIPAESIKALQKKLDSLKDEIVEVLKEEKEEKVIRQAEMELKKGENMIEHEKEIFSRPKRTWFQDGKQKAQAEELSKKQYQDGFGSTSGTLKQKKERDGPKRDKFSGLSRRAKRRKLALEEDQKSGDKGSTNAAIRQAKKAARPGKIGEVKPPPSKRNREKKAAKVGEKKARGFDHDMGEKRRKSEAGGSTREGFRAKKGDAVSLSGKNKKGRTGKVGKHGKGKSRR